MRVQDVVREYLLIAFRLDRLLPGAADASGMPRHCTSRCDGSPDRWRPRSSGRPGHSRPRCPPSSGGTGRASCEVSSSRVSGPRDGSGQAVPFVEEVSAAFGVRIRLGSEDAYRSAHRELDALLPGAGPLPDRMAAARPARSRRGGGRPRPALDARRGGAGRPGARLPAEPAVAGLHNGLRRGIRTAALLVGTGSAAGAVPPTARRTADAGSVRAEVAPCGRTVRPRTGHPAPHVTTGGVRAAMSGSPFCWFSAWRGEVTSCCC